MVYKPCPECGKHNHCHMLKYAEWHCATGDVVKFFIHIYNIKFSPSSQLKIHLITDTMHTHVYLDSAISV